MYVIRILFGGSFCCVVCCFMLRVVWFERGNMNITKLSETGNILTHIWLRTCLREHPSIEPRPRDIEEEIRRGFQCLPDTAPISIPRGGIPRIPRRLVRRRRWRIGDFVESYMFDHRQ
mmetsp:Transcript_32094/g.65248  ORF Transcript_32094/g.65248 Transcript_32094/m.65248 type:complete len:118 (+) Transcript_32094:1516-1869(+)